MPTMYVVPLRFDNVSLEIKVKPVFLDGRVFLKDISEVDMQYHGYKMVFTYETLKRCLKAVDELLAQYENKMVYRP